MPLTPSEAFLQVVHGVGHRRFDRLHKLYAVRTDVRHPMAPGGMPALTTRDAVRQHFAQAAAWTPTVRFQPGKGARRPDRRVPPEVLANLRS